MFNLDKLQFGEGDLAPIIDKKTIEFHYGKHHTAYKDNLNKLVSGTKYENMDIVEILKLIVNEPDAKLKNGIINNGGGFFNHNLFWHNLSPKSKDNSPSASFLNLIERDFGSLDKLKEELHTLALTQFGSGWAFLCKDKDGKLICHQALNQLNCYSMGMDGCKPLIALDVWEHAYYILYQNRRADFLKDLFEIIDWKKVESLY